MATIQLPTDFKDFLKLLNKNSVEYLLVGGYAVGYYGYPRATGDLDIWVSRDIENAARLSLVLREFGFGAADADEAIFLEPNKVIRMGIPPLRIELLTDISGVDFEECWAERESAIIDTMPAHIINLDKLKINKRASGRLKDLNDLSHLP